MPLLIGSPELEEKAAAVKAAGYRFDDQHDLRLRWLEIELAALKDDGFDATLDDRLEKLTERVKALAERLAETENEVACLGRVTEALEARLKSR